MNDNTATVEYVDSPAAQRLAWIQKARQERYVWAISVDPEAVKAFEARLKERLGR